MLKNPYNSKKFKDLIISRQSYFGNLIVKVELL